MPEAFSALRLLTDETAVEKLSKDFYWYSPC